MKMPVPSVAELGLLITELGRLKWPPALHIRLIMLRAKSFEASSFSSLGVCKRKDINRELALLVDGQANVITK